MVLKRYLVGLSIVIHVFGVAYVLGEMNYAIMRSWIFYVEALTRSYIVLCKHAGWIPSLSFQQQLRTFELILNVPFYFCTDNSSLCLQEKCK
jgi:hypothetical protein